ncbi:MAG TPA: ABC transporter permease [Bryobacteraceae bacterium]|nr:ABC transporter permease [Bryobacteraceae bacterium]
MKRTELSENLAVAMDTLRSRKVRSGLTILGIVIGVTSVIAVASIIDGLNGLIKERVQRLGSNTLFVTRIPPNQGPGRLPQKIRMRKYLQDDDAQFIEETSPAVAYATVFANRINFNEQTDEIRYGDAHVERFFLRGTQPEYAKALPLFAIAEGRFISSYDEEHARNVIVIGRSIADSLFPNLDPIGKIVRLDGRWYEVVGLFEPDQGLFSSFGVDQFACIPMSNFRKNFPEIRERFIAVAGKDEFSLDTVKGQVEEAMRRKRHVPHNAENDFEISDPDFLSALWGQLTGALVLLTGIISSIGLLVGGIGVMNIMLISVTERTSEIGLRKAVGARKADIRAQFLLEAVTLSGIGGVIGILAGALIALIVRTALPAIPAVVSPLWVGLGVAISVGVGLFFGYYPANRAANLDPIVCLRYE